ncbi:hypothetical protein [Anaerosinus massiliensis]|uniref:hypothetical protein n=1 Tax=Massilibacillus massiliensis TaxID=1806837 RepID=UPI000DA6068E|nr:hypothetical protein [Massilibacillus massiliensis]
MAREYMDETVLKVLQEAEDQAAAEAAEAALSEEIAAQDLESGEVLINRKLVRFAPREFLDGRVKISMPENWKDMELEVAKRKYPYETRPPIIQTDETMTFNLTLNHTNTPLKKEEMKTFIDAMKMYAGKAVKVQLIEQGESIEESGIVVGWFDFISPGFDELIYNFVFCTVLEKKALIMTFNCLNSQQERWRSVAHAMMHTLEIVDDHSEKEA